jgi:hypothetical protein
MLIRNGDHGFIVADKVITYFICRKDKTGGGSDGIQILYGKGKDAEFMDILVDGVNAVEIDYGDGNTKMFHLEQGIARIDVDRNEFGLARFVKAKEGTEFYR